MGIIKRGILGGFSGRIGNVVGSSWKGLAVVKSLPLSVANPRTTAQTTQRSKFSNTVALASLLLTNCIKPLWDRDAVHMSGFNAFCMANIPLMPSGEGPDLTGIILSEGPLGTLTDMTEAWDNTAHTLTIGWDGTPVGSYQAADDVILGFAYAPSEGELEFVAAGITRADEECVFTFTDNVATLSNKYYGVVALSADGFKAGTELCKKVG